MLDYLHTMGFSEAFDAMKRQTGLEYVDDGKQKYSGVLEKKWTSVLRLQKKVQSSTPRPWISLSVCPCPCACLHVPLPLRVSPCALALAHVSVCRCPWPWPTAV